VCCSVLQCVAVCCSVLQCVAVCCSVLQCVAVRLQRTLPATLSVLRYDAVSHGGLLREFQSYFRNSPSDPLRYAATHLATNCNTLSDPLQHTAAHFATHCNALQHTERPTESLCNTLGCPASSPSRLQWVAVSCSELQ